MCIAIIIINLHAHIQKVWYFFFFEKLIWGQNPFNMIFRAVLQPITQLLNLGKSTKLVDWELLLPISQTHVFISVGFIEHKIEAISAKSTHWKYGDLGLGQYCFEDKFLQLPADHIFQDIFKLVKDLHTKNGCYRPVSNKGGLYLI